MSVPTYSKAHLLIATCLGALVGYGAASVIVDKSGPSSQVIAMEKRVQELEALLAQQQAVGGEASARQQSQPDQAIVPMMGMVQAPVNEPATGQTDPDTSRAPEGANIEQLRKDLSTRFIGDPRTFPEKLGDFLAQNPGKQNIAIATKTLADMADNRETLPDYALESLYQEQPNPDVKRVAAQLLSLRGDNSLIDKQVARLQTGLNSSSPAERQKALVELGKTHYAGAATAIAPMLQDADIAVKLDALLALRATGNQSHLRYVEELADHPDESVSWLANDVINNLQNLSDRARTRVNNADIVAELPVISAQ